MIFSSGRCGMLYMKSLFPFELKNKKLFNQYKKLVLAMNKEDNFGIEKDESIKYVINESECMNKSNNHIVTLFYSNENMVRPIGYSAWYLSDADTNNLYDYVWITHIYFKKKYRKKGFYTEFLEKLPSISEEIYDIRPKYIQLGIFNKNEDSMKIHESLGFEKVFISYFKKV